VFTQHRQGGGPEPEGGHDTGGLGVDEVADLGAGQWRVAEVVVGGDERVVDAGVGAGGDRARPAGQSPVRSVCTGGVAWAGVWRRCRPLPLELRGAGRTMSPSAAILFSATRALIALVAPSTRRQPRGGVLHASNHDGVAPHEAAYNLAQGRVRTAMELRGQLPSN